MLKLVSTRICTFTNAEFLHEIVEICSDSSFVATVMTTKRSVQRCFTIDSNCVV